MKRMIYLVAAVLAAMLCTSATSTAGPWSFKTSCVITAPSNVSPSGLQLNGSCRYGKQKLPLHWSWQITGETDASGAPLPAQPTSGTGAKVAAPIQGGYQLAITAKLSTPAVKKPKAKAHPAGIQTKSLTVTLGGYTAIGTQVPSIGGVAAGDPYCNWAGEYLGAGDKSPTVHLPSVFHCGPSAAMGACQWESTPPESPTDPIPNRDGVVTTTGLTIYGGRVACANGYIAVPQVGVLFGYYGPDGQLTDSCELELAGVTSFTVPASWGGNISFYANLLTFAPAGNYNANQAMQSPYSTRTTGSVNVCQTYHLPALKP